MGILSGWFGSGQSHSAEATTSPKGPAAASKPNVWRSVFDPGSNPNIDRQGSNYYDKKVGRGISQQSSPHCQLSMSPNGNSQAEHHYQSSVHRVVSSCITIEYPGTAASSSDALFSLQHGSLLSCSTVLVQATPQSLQL